MRSVSLVNRLEFEFTGPLFQNGLCFGDVDNDQVNELVACSTNGELAIYKGKNTKPWRKCSGLGFATFVAVDNVCNAGQNNILVINADGMCYTFNLSNADRKLSDERCGKHPQEKGKSKSLHSNSSLTQILPKFKQQLAPNCRTAIIFDIDGDDKRELIAAYTDRTVRIFRWEEPHGTEATPDTRTKEQSSSKKQSHKLIKQSSKDEDRKLLGPVKQSSKDSARDLNISGTDSDSTEPPPDSSDPFESIEEGKFVLIKKIGILAQIGSLAVCSIGDGCHHLLASQPGGGYIVLETHGKNDSDDEFVSTKSKANRVSKSLDNYPVRYLLSGTRSRPLVGNTEIIGSVQRQGRLSGLMGFCTLDGTFGIMDFVSSNPVVQQMVTDHKWFTMDKLDITTDGNDEILLCAWDGMTYVINRHQDILCYNFGENVCAFTAGMYSLQSRINVPCLCYATFSNRIMLYYDIKVDSMEAKSLHNEIIERLSADSRYETILQSLKDKDGNIDPEKLRSLIRN